MTSSYKYPFLKLISSLYNSEKKSFDKIYILACQHILEPQAKMFNLISCFGVPKQNIHIFGKIYSTSNEILRELQGNNFKVSNPTFNQEISFDIEHSENCKKEFTNFLQSINVGSKIIILDDGGELLKVVNESFDLISKEISVIGIEQTSSGFRKLEYSDIHFPIFNVARSTIKLEKESPFIASLNYKRIQRVLNQYCISEPRILIVGLGPIGNNTLSHLSNKGYFVIGYDIAHHNKTEIIDLIKKNNINLVIGATGSNILDSEQLQKINSDIKRSIYLVSVSSSDREFPTNYIRSNSNTTRTIHDDITWRNITLINNGFPITFKGNRNESTPEEIERTIGLLYGSTLEAIVTNIQEKGFINVPKKIVQLL